MSLRNRDQMVHALVWGACVPLEKLGGKEPIGLPEELGTKSKRGANKSATLNWVAILRPRSKGILDAP
jgi:hypothetical protein